MATVMDIQNIDKTGKNINTIIKCPTTYIEMI